MEGIPCRMKMKVDKLWLLHEAEWVVLFRHLEKLNISTVRKTLINRVMWLLFVFSDCNFTSNIKLFLGKIGYQSELCYWCLLKV